MQESEQPAPGWSSPALRSPGAPHHGHTCACGEPPAEAAWATAKTLNCIDINIDRAENCLPVTALTAHAHWQHHFDLVAEPTVTPLETVSSLRKLHSLCSATR